MIVAVSAIGMLVGCDDSDAGGGTGSGTTGSGSNQTGSSGGPSEPSGTATSGPTDSRPVIGNIELSPANVQCSYVPNGNLDGSDGLTVFAYTLLIGTNSLPETIATTMSVSNGHTATYNGHPNNQAVAAYQGPILAGDWGRTLTVRLIADANDRYRESDEADNSITVSIDLPASRPNRTVDPLACSARRP